MSKRKILVQLDSDPQPSVFDSVVALDAGAEHLLQYGRVAPDDVRNLVYGAIFTRAVADLKSTAIFVGGSDVAAGERLLCQVTGTFFGPMRVSVMLDSNGANTTAAAAVLAVGRHVELKGADVAVLGATGPVGQRVVRLLAGAGCQVRVVSRSRERAQKVASDVARRHPAAQLAVYEAGEGDRLLSACEGAQAIVAAGALGVTLLPAGSLNRLPTLAVAIDLNAVPPLGVADIDAQDRGVTRGHVICYGALGVGGLKMKIHRAAIAKLFDANDQLLDAEEILAIGQQLKL